MLNDMGGLGRARGGWGGHMDAGMHGWETSGWGGPLWAVLLVLAVSALVTLVVLLARQPGAGAVTADRDARALLDRRYALGELGTDEYRERLREMSGQPEPRR